MSKTEEGACHTKPFLKQCLCSIQRQKLSTHNQAFFLKKCKFGAVIKKTFGVLIRTLIPRGALVKKITERNLHGQNVVLPINWMPDLA